MFSRGWLTTVWTKARAISACVGVQKMLAKWKAGEKGRTEGRKEGRKGFIILTDQF